LPGILGVAAAVRDDLEEAREGAEAKSEQAGAMVDPLSMV
jgi:hypothetical protein